MESGRKGGPNKKFGPPILTPSGVPGLALRLGLDDLVEHQLAALDLVSAVIGERGVAVLVDRVLAEDRVAVLDLEELIDDGLAVVALVTRVLDREQSHLHRLVAVYRV